MNGRLWIFSRCGFTSIMIKFGVHHPEDFPFTPPASLSGKIRKFFSNNRYSYLLMRTPVPAPPSQVTIFETITQQMLLSGNIYRTTFRGRFANLNPTVEQVLGERFAADAPVEVADWASSDCLTSAEWAQGLLERFPNATYTASDLTLSLLAIRMPGGEVFIIETNGEPLQYITGPLVVRLNPPEPSMLWVNRVLASSARRKLTEILPTLRLPEDWLFSLGRPGEPALSQPGGISVEKFPIVHPEALGLVAANPRFRIVRHSAFESLAVPVDVVRSMNIFNKSYFGPERLAEGAQAVWRSLKPGGIWIVGRTVKENPPVHEVSIFTRTETGFELVRRVGPGSEIEALVLAA